MTSRQSFETDSDTLDAAYEAVWARYPDIEGEALERKVRRLIAIMRHASDGPTWTEARHDARGL